MPILNLNGVSRKPSRLVPARNLNRDALSAAQHPTLGFSGKTYNSPFTASAIPPLNDSHNSSTQTQLPALKVETPGKVVPLHSFVKVHPDEKTATVKQAFPAQGRPAYTRTGGPSKHADTPANPNIRKVPTQRPKRTPHKASEKLKAGHSSIGQHAVAGSFLSTNAILGSHSNHDVVSVGRWDHIKKGVVA